MRSLLAKRGTWARRGKAAVEFAFVSPILVVTLVAIVDLSNYFIIAYDVQRGAKDGARAGSLTLLQPGETGVPIETAATTQANLVLNSTATAGVTCTSTSAWTLNGGFGSLAGFWQIQVTTTCPYNPLILNSLIVSGNPITQISSSFIMMTQQQGLIP